MERGAVEVEAGSGAGERPRVEEGAEAVAGVEAWLPRVRGGFREARRTTEWFGVTKRCC